MARAGSPKSGSKYQKVTGGGRSLIICLTIFAILVTSVGVFFNQVNKGQLKLHGTTDIASLSSYVGRLEFLGRYIQLPLIWLIFSCFSVVMVRIVDGSKYAIMEPQDQNRYNAAVVRANDMFRNSLEQFVMFSASQLGLISYLTADQAAIYIPFLSIVHLVGRIAFQLGYPRQRTGGFVLTFAPTVLSAVFVVNKLLTDQFELR
ncbi:hypothetical protein HDE_14025 [Halotydeus destructor]|nr:hypothetical protein HDE_14025 [Halotydeus destructor]